MPVLLVQYGVTGFVGAFTASESLPRGALALVQTPRGCEVGTVLNPLEASAPHEPLERAGGVLLRALTEADRHQWTRDQLHAQELLRIADDLPGYPVSVLDVEPLYGKSGLIVHLLAWGECDLEDLLQGWQSQFGQPVRVLDLSALPPAAEPKSGCGKEGCRSGDGCGTGSCGTSSGGCGTGSCSKGKVQSAEEMTAYFRSLREQMESQRRALNY
jgi:hypothetical protein